VKHETHPLIWLSLPLLMIWLLIPAPVTGLGNHEKITCEDGEEFLVEEKNIINTLNQTVSEGDMIVVDARALHLIFYRKGKIFKTYPVAIGTPETPSPIGEWRIIHKGGNWGDGFGVRWMGINVPWGIYGIHGTDKPYSIGSRSSHGCIRMFNNHVLELYNITKVGTPVYIVGDLPKTALRRDIGLKSTGRDVLVLQYTMRKAGFYQGMADARFGPEMETAAWKLQYFYGLAPTGRVSMNEQYLLGIR
jgi:hypothetical protein